MRPCTPPRSYKFVFWNTTTHPDYQDELLGSSLSPSSLSFSKRKYLTKKMTTTTAKEATTVTSSKTPTSFRSTNKSPTGTTFIKRRFSYQKNNLNHRQPEIEKEEDNCMIQVTPWSSRQQGQRQPQSNTKLSSPPSLFEPSPKPLKRGPSASSSWYRQSRCRYRNQGKSLAQFLSKDKLHRHHFDGSSSSYSTKCNTSTDDAATADSTEPPPSLVQQQKPEEEEEIEDDLLQSSSSYSSFSFASSLSSSSLSTTTNPANKSTKEGGVQVNRPEPWSPPRRSQRVPLPPNTCLVKPGEQLPFHSLTSSLTPTTTPTVLERSTTTTTPFSSQNIRKSLSRTHFKTREPDVNNNNHIMNSVESSLPRRRFSHDTGSKVVDTTTTATNKVSLDQNIISPILEMNDDNSSLHCLSSSSSISSNSSSSQEEPRTVSITTNCRKVSSSSSLTMATTTTTTRATTIAHMSTPTQKVVVAASTTMKSSSLSQPTVTTITNYNTNILPNWIRRRLENKRRQEEISMHLKC